MKVVSYYGDKNPLPIIHDAAEAILIGLWGMLNMGWITSLPGFIK